MRFAYADPPYLGHAVAHYAEEAAADGRVASEVDHVELVDRLSRDYPDGWALSLSSPTLKTILPMCPGDVRVMAWVKSFASYKPNVNPAYAWEPVIVRGGRQPRSREEWTVRDWVSCPITLKRGVSGAKPERFCWWLFDVLGAQPGDELVDLYPGSGAVAVAWRSWQANRPLDLGMTS